MQRRRRHPPAFEGTPWQANPPRNGTSETPDAYLLPRNIQEMHRLDFQHYLLRLVLKGNVVAPIDPGVRSILDVGCGTGRWPQEMARTYPWAQVVGLDLTADHQKLLPGASGNYTFLQGNVFDGLPFADHSFDLTHQRFLVAAIPAAKWPFVLHELVRVTRPGGWVELVEASDVFRNPGPLTRQWLSWWTTLASARGFDASLVRRLGEGLQYEGLHPVSTRIIEVPLGPWMRGKQREGTMLQEDMLSGLSNLTDLFCTTLSLSPDEVGQVLAGLPQEWMLYQTRYQLVLAYGQL